MNSQRPNIAVNCGHIADMDKWIRMKDQEFSTVDKKKPLH